MNMAFAFAAKKLNDFIDSSQRFYKNVRPDEVKVSIVDPGSRILHEMTEDLAAYALDKLQKRGMEFHFKTIVTGVAPDSVELDGSGSIPTNTPIWAAGTASQPVVEVLSCKKNRGRIIVDEFLEVI